MLSTPGEGEAAKPQERKEFNREKCNSKATGTGPRNHGAQADDVDERREADDSAPEDDGAGAGLAQGGEPRGGKRDQHPVPQLEAPKARLRGHSARIAGEA